MSYINYKDDGIDYERDHITSKNGVVTSYKLNNNEYETASKRMHNENYFQHKPQKEIGLFRLIDRIQRLFQPAKLTFGNENVYDIKSTDKIKVGNLEIDRLYLPENSFLSYVNSKTQNYSLKELNSVTKAFSKTAKEFCSAKKGLENYTKEITAVLFYDDLLKKIFVQDNSIADIPKKSKIEELAKAGSISPTKLKSLTSKIKGEYSREIFQYKQQNNLLTYTDLKKYNHKIIDKIKREIEDNEKETFSSIAKKYGLKNSKVVSKIALENYLYNNSDLNESIGNILKIA